MPPKRKRPTGGGAADLRRRGRKAVLLAFTPEEIEELKQAAGTFADRRRHVSVYAAGVVLADAREINARTRTPGE